LLRRGWAGQIKRFRDELRRVMRREDIKMLRKVVEDELRCAARSDVEEMKKLLGVIQNRY